MQRKFGVNEKPRQQDRADGQNDGERGAHALRVARAGQFDNNSGKTGDRRDEGQQQKGDSVLILFTGAFPESRDITAAGLGKDERQIEQDTAVPSGQAACRGMHLDRQQRDADDKADADCGEQPAVQPNYF